MLSLKLLGCASIREESAFLGGEAGQPRRIALMALLATTPTGAMTREKLIGYLWPETAAGQGRRLLSESLYVLRRAIGAEKLLSEGEVVRLHPDAITCDVLEFEAALEQGDLEHAVSAYGGPFLDGFYVRDAPEFERWVESERCRHADSFATALEKLAEAAEAAHDHLAAVGRWKRLIAHDPYNSRYVLRSMQAVVAAGDPANAIQQAEEHARVLQQDLGIEPPRDLVALADRLREEPIPPVPVRVDRDAPGSAVTEEPLGVASTTEAPEGSGGTGHRRRTGQALGAFVALGAVVAAGWLILRNGDVEPQRKSVAVLPFVNIGGDTANEYFSDGITIDLINQLGKIADLEVKSRTSVMQYKGTEKNLRKVGNELGASVVVEGGVQRSGDRLRISAQLIDVESDAHLWADQYERRLGDLFAIQGEIAHEIAAALDIALSPEERERIAAQPTLSQEAYDLYLRANNYFRAGTETGLDRGPLLRQALELYGQAVEADPGFALAYANMAVAHLYTYWFGFDQTRAHVSLAQIAVNRALELNPDLGEAYLALGLYRYWGHRDYETALAAFDEARRRLPGEATIYRFVGAIFKRMGRYEEAIVSLRRDFEQNPRAASTAIEIGLVHGALRQNEEAIRWYARARAIAPHWAGIYLAEASAYLRLGDVQAARAIVAEAPDPTKPAIASAGFWIEAYARQFDAAAAWLERYQGPAFSFQSGVTPLALYSAHLHRWRGEDEQAREAYQDAVAFLDTLGIARPHVGRSPALAVAYAGLGEREAALALIDSLAVERRDFRDAFVRAVPYEGLAHVYALLGQHDKAIDVLEDLTRMQYNAALTPACLRLDPRWDPLRGHPRFQLLLDK